MIIYSIATIVAVIIATVVTMVTNREYTSYGEDTVAIISLVIAIAMTSAANIYGDVGFMPLVAFLLLWAIGIAIYMACTSFCEWGWSEETTLEFKATGRIAMTVAFNLGASFVSSIIMCV